MKRIRIEEVALQRLEEQARRAIDLAESLAAEQRRTSALEAEVVRLRLAEAAAAVIDRRCAEAQVVLNRPTRRGLMADAVLDESGALDVAAFEVIVDEEIWPARVRGAVDVQQVIETTRKDS